MACILKKALMEVEYEEGRGCVGAWTIDGVVGRVNVGPQWEKENRYVRT